MIRIASPRRRNRSENTIPLINVVFLLLIFFLLAGTLAPPLDRAITPVAVAADPAQSLDALSVAADGTLTYHSALTSIAAYAASLDQAGTAPARLFVDRHLPATALLRLLTQLKAAGAQKVIVITDRKAA